MPETPTSSRDRHHNVVQLDSSSSSDEEDEDKRTLFCANLHEEVTEELMFELFIQAGPLETVKIPKDKDGRQRNFGFVTYQHSCSIPYALSIFEGVTLFRQKVVIRRRNGNNSKPSKSSADVDLTRNRGGGRGDRDRDYDRGGDYNRHRDRDNYNSLRGNAQSHHSMNESNMQPAYRNDSRRQNNQIDLFDPVLISQLTQNVMFGPGAGQGGMQTVRSGCGYDDDNRKNHSSHRNTPYSRDSSRNYHSSHRNDRRSEQRTRHR